MFGAVCRQHKAWSHLCQPPLVRVTPVSLATWDAANRQWFLMACLPRNMTSVTFKNIFELDRRAIKMMEIYTDYMELFNLNLFYDLLF